MDKRRRRIPLLVIGVTLAVAAGLVAVGARLLLAPEEIQAQPVIPADPTEVYDPVAAGEELPDGYRPLLSRDLIAPVYDPVFTSAGGVDWPGDSLVIGVAGAETAKAYPVTHLNSREMVIDSLEGIPILVTW